MGFLCIASGTTISQVMVERGKLMSKAPFLAFMAGAAIGSFVTWRMVKGYYAKQSQEEIDSVKEVFSGRYKESFCENDCDGCDEQNPEPVVQISKDEKSELMAFAKKLRDEGYTDYGHHRIPDDEPKASRPYTIPPYEFGEADGYSRYTLKYYADGVLTDDADSPIDDIDGLVGEESLDTFGEYEEDTVFVRNERTKADYEILREPGTYSDFIEENPYKAEV